MGNGEIAALGLIRQPLYILYKDVPKPNCSRYIHEHGMESQQKQYDCHTIVNGFSMAFTRLTTVLV